MNIITKKVILVVVISPHYKVVQSTIIATNATVQVSYRITSTNTTPVAVGRVTVAGAPVLVDGVHPFACRGDTHFCQRKTQRPLHLATLHL